MKATITLSLSEESIKKLKKMKNYSKYVDNLIIRDLRVKYGSNLKLIQEKVKELEEEKANTIEKFDKEIKQYKERIAKEKKRREEKLKIKKEIERKEKEKVKWRKMEKFKIISKLKGIDAIIKDYNPKRPFKWVESKTTILKKQNNHLSPEEKKVIGSYNLEEFLRNNYERNRKGN